MEALEERLYTVLNDLHDRTFKKYYLGEPTVIRESLTVDKRYGTALVALCFMNFV
jgi:arginine decarboxylase